MTESPSLLAHPTDHRHNSSPDLFHSQSPPHAISPVEFRPHRSSTHRASGAYRIPRIGTPRVSSREFSRPFPCASYSPSRLTARRSTPGAYYSAGPGCASANNKYAATCARCYLWHGHLVGLRRRRRVSTAPIRGGCWAPQQALLVFSVHARQSGCIRNQDHCTALCSAYHIE